MDIKNFLLKKIINNESLKYYQKILLIEFISDLCSNYNSRKEIEDSKFEYYLMNKKEKNSVLDIVENFFREYREKLHENSPIFETLIELEGGAGIFKDELNHFKILKKIYMIRRLQYFITLTCKI